MLKLAKWVAIIILLPIIVIKEIFAVVSDAGIEIPDADEVLDNIKKAKAEADSTAKSDCQVESYEDRMDF